MKNYRYGVSPAYLLSTFGEGFTPDDIVSALAGIKALGFDEFQCELVSDKYLPLWEHGGGVRVANAAKAHGLIISQMVAHFMIENFKDEQSLFSDSGIPEMETLFSVLDEMGYKGQVTLPMGPYSGLANLTDDEKRQALKRLKEKIESISNIAYKHDCYIAVEIQPGALISGGKEILAFIEGIGKGINYNYDTGHAWASGDRSTADFPLYFRERMTGTHLCDNDGVTNLSLAPGKGTIPWDSLIDNLVRGEYEGGLDLEIFTTPDLVAEEYATGLRELRARVDAACNSLE